MTIPSVPIVTAGVRSTITCIVTFDDYLQARPSLNWILAGNTDDISFSTESTSESGSTSTSILTFNPLHTSHGGVYTCEATVNISGITVQSVDTNVTVLVQSKLIFTGMMIS